MTVEIDKKSGFCFGVQYAIERAENELENQDELYCLGDIVHNNAEVERLKAMGLKSIDKEKFKTLKNTKVLIRAHGEPPETYKIALENNIQLLDASCPVVLRLQNNIKKGYDKVTEEGGQLIIFGKKGHAEVSGLVGQTQGKAIVVASFDDLDKIDFTKPISLFSQTTKSPQGYKDITEEIKRRMALQQKNEINFAGKNTICGQVSNRDGGLKEFAQKHDVVIFVSGKKSSNGKVLFAVCKAENPRTHFISVPKELDLSWLTAANSVGICGATSTPRWLMEETQKWITDHI